MKTYPKRPLSFRDIEITIEFQPHAQIPSVATMCISGIIDPRLSNNGLSFDQINHFNDPVSMANNMNAIKSNLDELTSKVPLSNESTEVGAV